MYVCKWDPKPSTGTISMQQNKSDNASRVNSFSLHQAIRLGSVQVRSRMLKHVPERIIFLFHIHCYTAILHCQFVRLNSNYSPTWNVRWVWNTLPCVIKHGDFEHFQPPWILHDSPAPLCLVAPLCSWVAPVGAHCHSQPKRSRNFIQFIHFWKTSVTATGVRNGELKTWWLSM